MKNFFICSLLLAVVSAVSNATVLPAAGDVVLNNGEMSLTIGGNGIVKSLIHLPTDREMLQEGVDAPVCVITQYRPYDNENFLMFPAKPRRFNANKAWMNGDTLMVEFTDTYDIAKLKVDVTPNYIAMKLVGRDYRIEDFGVKRKTELDEFTLMQLPIKPLPRFGEWLNVMWDDDVAVALVGTAPETYIDSRIERDNTTLNASTHSAIKLMGPGAAIVTTAPATMLDRMAKIEEDFDMPRGVESRRRHNYAAGYYELRDVTVDNIDRNIELCKQAGLRTMVVYYPDFAKACGHFEWNDKYPHGMEDLKTITRKIRAAGIIPGIHIHYSKVAINDPYINNGCPDRRIAVVSRFTLVDSIGPTDTVLTVEELPENLRWENGRRLLHVDDEIMSFDSVRTERPYAFTGVRRCLFNSKPASHACGNSISHLDVDDWPLFLRIDQNTNIQREIANRLGKIYNDCGFEFVYFDGAEDVPMPYWYNVSRSQLEVYNALSPKPLWCEGAQKSHYGWHILSRGNAFDVFPPERIRVAMRRYTLRCAEQVACDFTSVNFGWINYMAPNDKTMGMQPDHFDYICSKATSWNSPISLVANLADIERHPRTSDNMLALKLWEDAKLSGGIDSASLVAMRDPLREWTLRPNKKGTPELIEVFQITPDDIEVSVRAFGFKVSADTSAIIYWDKDGKTPSIVIDGLPSNARLETFDGRKLKIKRNKEGKAVLPANGRHVICYPGTLDDATSWFKNAIRTK